MGNCGSEIVTLRQLFDDCNCDTKKLIKLVEKYYESVKFGKEEMKVVKLLLADNSKDHVRFFRGVEIYLSISKIFNDLNLYYLVASFNSINYTLEISDTVIVITDADTQKLIQTIDCWIDCGSMYVYGICLTDFPTRFYVCSCQRRFNHYLILLYTKIDDGSFMLTGSQLEYQVGYQLIDMKLVTTTVGEQLKLEYQNGSVTSLNAESLEKYVT
jgi:hypothetical protein